jgi:hypothetical protein
MQSMICRFACLACSLFISVFSVAQNNTLPKSSLVDVNYAALVSRADLQYDTPVIKSEAGLPIGNGRMGSLVWTIPSAIEFQINRVDVFGNNSATNNFYERNTDYCGGAGAVRIDFGEPLLTTPDFKEYLSCYDATVAVTGKQVQAQVMAWNEKDVMAVHITDNRNNHLPVNIDLSTLRLPVTHKGNHTAVSTIQPVNGFIVLKQEFKEDDYYCASALVIGTDAGKSFTETVSESTIRLAVTASSDYTIYMGTAATFNKKEDVVQKAMDQLPAARQMGYSGLRDNNSRWWHNF